jgi:hypothetical protein
MKTGFYSGSTASALALMMGIGIAAAQTGGTVEPVGPGGVVNQPLELTAAQKNAIVKAVGHDKTKMASVHFSATIGAAVPPSISLYPLPDEAVNNNAAAKLYQFTVVDDDVVIVDPTKMQVVEVIRKSSR